MSGIDDTAAADARKAKLAALRAKREQQKQQQQEDEVESLSATQREGAPAESSRTTSRKASPLPEDGSRSFDGSQSSTPKNDDARKAKLEALRAKREAAKKKKEEEEATAANNEAAQVEDVPADRTTSSSPPPAPNDERNENGGRGNGNAEHVGVESPPPADAVREDEPGEGTSGDASVPPTKEEHPVDEEPVVGNDAAASTSETADNATVEEATPTNDNGNSDRDDVGNGEQAAKHVADNSDEQPKSSPVPEPPAEEVSTPKEDVVDSTPENGEPDGAASNATPQPDEPEVAPQEQPADDVAESEDTEAVDEGEGNANEHAGEDHGVDDDEDGEKDALDETKPGVSTEPAEDAEVEEKERSEDGAEQPTGEEADSPTDAPTDAPVAHEDEPEKDSLDATTAPRLEDDSEAADHKDKSPATSPSDRKDDDEVSVKSTETPRKVSIVEPDEASNSTRSSPARSSLKSHDNNTDCQNLDPAQLESTISIESEAAHSNSSQTTPQQQQASPSRRKSVRLVVDGVGDCSPGQELLPNNTEEERPSQPRESKIQDVNVEDDAFCSHSLKDVPSPSHYSDAFNATISTSAKLSANEAEQHCTEIVDHAVRLYAGREGKADAEDKSELTFDRIRFGINESFQGLLDGPSFADVFDSRRVMLKALTTNNFKRAIAVAAQQVQSEGQQDGTTSTAEPYRRTSIGEGNSQSFATEGPLQGFVRQGDAPIYLHAKEGLLMRVWSSGSEARKFALSLQRLWQVLYDYGIPCIYTCVASLVSYRDRFVTVTQLPPLLTTKPFVAETNAAPVLQHACRLLATCIGSEKSLPVPLHLGGDGRYYAIATAGICQFDITQRLPGSDAMSLARLEGYPQIPLLASKRAVTALVTEDLATDAAINVLKALSQSRQPPDVHRFVRENRITSMCHAVGVNMQFLHSLLETEPMTVELHDSQDAATEAIKAEMAVRAVKAAHRAELRVTHWRDEDGMFPSVTSTPDIASERLNRLIRSCGKALKGDSSTWDDVNVILRKKFKTSEDFFVEMSPSLLKTIVARLSHTGAIFMPDKARFTRCVGVGEAAVCFGVPDTVKEVLRKARTGGGKKHASPAKNKHQSTLQLIVDDDDDTDEAEDEETAARMAFARRRRSSLANVSFTRQQSEDGTAPDTFTAGDASLARRGSMVFVSPGSEKNQEVAVGSLRRTGTFVRNAAAEQLAVASESDAAPDAALELLSHVQRARFCVLLRQEKEAAKIAERFLMPSIGSGMRMSATAAVLSGMIYDLGPDCRALVDADHAREVNALRSQHDTLYISLRLRNMVTVELNETDEAIDVAPLTRVVAATKRLPLLDMSFHAWLERLVCEACSRLDLNHHATTINSLMNSVARLSMADHSRSSAFLKATRNIAGTLIAREATNACAEMKPILLVSLKLHEDRYGAKETRTAIAASQLICAAGYACRPRMAPHEVREVRRFQSIVVEFGRGLSATNEQEAILSSAFVSMLGTMTQLLSEYGETSVASRAMMYSVNLAGNRPQASSVARGVDFVRAKATALIAAVCRMRFRPESFNVTRCVSDEVHHRLGVEIVSLWGFGAIEQEYLADVEGFYRRAVEGMERQVRGKVLDAFAEQARLRKTGQPLLLSPSTTGNSRRSSILTSPSGGSRRTSLDSSSPQRRRGSDSRASREISQVSEDAEDDDTVSTSSSASPVARRLAFERREAASKKKLQQIGRDIDQLPQDEATDRKTEVIVVERQDRELLRRLEAKERGAAQQATERRVVSEALAAEEAAGVHVQASDLDAFLSEDAMERAILGELRSRSRLAELEATQRSNWMIFAEELKGMAAVLGPEAVPSNPQRREEVMERMKRREGVRKAEIESEEKARDRAIAAGASRREALAKRTKLVDQAKASSTITKSQRDERAEGFKKKREAKEADDRTSKEAAKRAEATAAKWSKLDDLHRRAMAELSPRPGKSVRFGAKLNHDDPPPAHHHGQLPNIRPRLAPVPNSEAFSTELANVDAVLKSKEIKRKVIQERREAKIKERAADEVAAKKAAQTASHWHERRKQELDAVVRQSSSKSIVSKAGQVNPLAVAPKSLPPIAKKKPSKTAWDTSYSMGKNVLAADDATKQMRKEERRGAIRDRQQQWAEHRAEHAVALEKTRHEAQYWRKTGEHNRLERQAKHNHDNVEARRRASTILAQKEYAAIEREELEVLAMSTSAEVPTLPPLRSISMSFVADPEESLQQQPSMSSAPRRRSTVTGLNGSLSHHPLSSEETAVESLRRGVLSMMNARLRHQERRAQSAMR